MPGSWIRVMIVDDEDVFLGHLKSMINWKAHGFYICAEAGNGREAMEMIELHKPDIVITDIQMPEIDGLSLIAFITEKYPHIQTIALSGYDEYNYIRTGMKHGVIDYLLKHQITPGSLHEALEDACKRIDDGYSRGIAAKAVTEQAEVGMFELRRLLLRELLSGNIERKSVFSDRAKRVGLDIGGECFTIMVAEIDQMSMHKSRYTNSEWLMLFDRLTDMNERLAGDLGNPDTKAALVLAQPENRFVILFSMPGGYSFHLFNNYINTQIQTIRSAFKERYNITACYGISKLISDYRQIPARYKKALVMLESKIYHGKDIVFREDEETTETEELEEASFRLDDETRIRSLLRDGHVDELNLFVNALFDRWRDVYIEPGRLRMLFAELLSIPNRLARQEHIDAYELLNMDGVYDRMRYMTLDEMKVFYLNLCAAIIKQRSVQSGTSGHESTQKACSFIRRNYRHPISLNDVAAAADVNPSYLSRVFKADTGKTVMAYVNDVRIETAKKMLSEGIRLKDLVEQVGFNSTSYFITVFRQATGKTPMQYKELVMSDNHIKNERTVI